MVFILFYSCVSGNDPKTTEILPIEKYFETDSKDDWKMGIILLGGDLDRENINYVISLYLNPKYEKR